MVRRSFDHHHQENDGWWGSWIDEAVKEALDSRPTRFEAMNGRRLQRWKKKYISILYSNPLTDPEDVGIYLPNYRIIVSFFTDLLPTKRGSYLISLSNIMLINQSLR